MGPHFMLLLSIFVSYSNVSYIYPVSCLVEIKLFQIVSHVVFRKSAYSLMSRVTTSSNSIVTAVVNSYIYHQCSLMGQWGISYMYRKTYMKNYLPICQCVIIDFVMYAAKTVAVLCMLYTIRCNPMQPLYGACIHPLQLQQSQCLFIFLSTRSVSVSNCFNFTFFILWVGIVALRSSD